MIRFLNTQNKKFSTKNETFVQLYGYALRDKFAAICQADLTSKILNKTENDIMLLRSNFINISHVNNIYSVYNGYIKSSLHIKLNMVGFRVGEFIFSRKIKNLNSNEKSLRKIYKRVQKPKAKLSKDRRNLTSHRFNVIKMLCLKKKI